MAGERYCNLLINKYLEFRETLSAATRVRHAPLQPGVPFLPAAKLIAGQRFQQFDAIPERVSNVRPIVSEKRFIDGDNVASVPAALKQLAEIHDEQRRMSFLCGSKVVLDSQMNVRVSR